MIFPLILVLFSSISQANESGYVDVFPACELRSVAVHKKLVEQIATKDKFKHCDLSCRITLDCGAIGAWMIGNLKEFADVFGPGEADVRDLVANNRGISIGRSRYTKTYGDCDLGCDRFYPRHE